MMPLPRLRLFFLAALVPVVLTTPVRAQREALSLRTEWLAPASLSVSDLPLSASSGTVTGVSTVAAWAKRSVLNKKGTAVLTSTLSYRNTQLNYDFAPYDGPRPLAVLDEDLFVQQLNRGITLHQVQADLLYMRVLNSKWMLYALGRPAMMSDLEQSVNGRDFRFEGAVFTEYRAGSKLRWGPGLSRSSAFGRVLWIPLVRVLYRPAPSVVVDGLLPSRLDVWYLPNKKWEFGAGLALNGGQYRFDGGRMGGNQFGFANGLAQVQVRRQISGKWYLQTDAGLSVVPRQELTRYDYRLWPGRTILTDLQPDPFPVVRAGLFKVF